MSSGSMNSISSRELNYMIYRYLQRSGFAHSAFNLGNEAAIDNETSADLTSAPPEALITLVHKGLQYLEMEANMTKDMTDPTEDFIFIKPFDLITKNVDELKLIVEEKKKQMAAEDTEIVVKDTQRENTDDKANYKLKEPETSGVRRYFFPRSVVDTSFHGPEPMNLSAFSTPLPRAVRSSDVLVMGGHSAEIWACAWSPAGLLLASGSGDSTARIWGIADRPNSVINRLANVLVLKHGKAKPKEKKRDVATLDWNLDGTLLATGSYDGLARIWNTNGELKRILSKHKGPIVSVKWNTKGDALLTGSSDKSVVVWDVDANEWKQQFKFHSGPILDVDWRTNRTFASGSTDTMIYVCKIGESHPLKLFTGHKGEVNCVKWDPSGLLLASCSDDMTVKLWSMKQDMPLHDFKDYAKGVYTIRWCPIGSGTDDSNTQLLLASGSFDSSVKIWDVESGRLFHNLNGHRDAVFTISFSPNGKYLATGSRDKLVIIWSVKEGKIMKTYRGNGTISQVSWSQDGKKIAYSAHSKFVCVSDVRM